MQQAVDGQLAGGIVVKMEKWGGNSHIINALTMIRMSC
jgi:hypothetical protein